MKTITTTKTIYEFSELSEDAKERAINNHSCINVDYDWWEFVYEDAKNVGLKITSFGLDRNREANGEWIQDADFCANEILSNHGHECETYKTASRYIEDRNKLDIEEQEDELYDLDKQFLYDILEDFSIMLQKESEWLMSDEAIIETIEANQYEFDEDGNRA